MISRLLAVVLFVISSAAVPTAWAQAGPMDPTNFVPRYTLGLGYNNIRANAPPTSCGCFDMNGGFVSGSVELKYWLSAVGEITAGHANDIGPLGQNLTLTTYTAGPRVNFRRERFVTYGQALIGAAHGSDSYFPEGTSYSASASSFAFSAGGGLDYHLNHRFAIQLIEAQYLHTAFPNGANDSQSHLMLGAGLVLKFHGHYAQNPPSRSRR